MRMKNMFGLFLLSLCVINFIACDNDKDKVEITTLYVSAQTGNYKPWGSEEFVECMLVREGKEAEYSPLDFSGIAGFKYERGYAYELLVEKKTLSNPMADASSIEYILVEILSQNSPSSFMKVEIRYGIDAEIIDGIRDDLEKTRPVPVNGGYLITPVNSYSILDVDKQVLQSGTFRDESNLKDKDIPDSYKLVPVDDNIVTRLKWIFNWGEGEKEYDTFIVRYKLMPAYAGRLWFYEDLTDYYQTKYPDAGVEGVVRVQILTYEP